MRELAEPPVYENLRMTIPVRESLEAAGNVVFNSMTEGRYDVLLHRPPKGLVLCLIGHSAEQHSGLRTKDEPKYPQEWPDGSLAWHDYGDWVGCPKCGGALVWFEAGYVPGYRLCTKGHHVQLSEDGRSAKVVR